MQIVKVIPIGRGINKDTLTYFTKKDITIGSIVSIPLRKKIIFGLVIESNKAEELKSELKNLPYNIKKIDEIKTHKIVRSDFISSIQKIADYNTSSSGNILSILIPKIILEESKKIPYIDTKEKPKDIFHEISLLQSDNEERYATYKGLIREEFAKNHSVFFCLPSVEDLVNAKTILEKGIEKYTYILHSNLNKKEIINLWKKIIEEPHPVLIIATLSFISIPRKDLGTIILDKESSRGYKMQLKPYIDIRKTIEIIAKEYGVKLVLGDIFLRIETLWEEKNGTYTDLSPLKFRSLTTAETELIDVRSPEDMKKKEFKIFDEKLKKMIKEAKENNELTFLFCGRKGLYPQTICSDCGTIVVCKNCNAPVVLYSKKKDGIQKNLFVCHKCGERRETKELCVHCNGWRLNPMGIGTERVKEEAMLITKEENIFILDKENVKTHKQAIKIRDAFYKTPGAVMIGTEMALNYLNEKIENSAVVSLDSYFSIPDFQINEKIFHILLEMRSITQKKLIFQTRQEINSSNWKIFDYAIKGNLMDFYRDEIEERRIVNFPPFSIYIKITLEGEKNETKKMMEKLAEFLKPYELGIFDAFNPGNKSKYTVHGLISLPKNKWVDKALLDKLKRIPPQFTIKIDPATLL